MRLDKDSNLWSEFKGFFTYEECGDIDYHFLNKVYELRKYLGISMIVIDGAATTGHSPNSFHYKGHAIDFHVHDRLSPRIVMSKIDGLGLFGGVGLYLPSNPNGVRSYHIDDRDINTGYQRWISPKRGEYIYLVR